jgi:hypothetical protein
MTVCVDVRRARAAALCLVSVFIGTGCGDDDDEPRDVAGQYTVNVTNGENGCLTGLQMGDSYSNISLDLTQDGETVRGTFGGLLATLFLEAVLGGTDFQGTVRGNTIEMTRLGNREQTSGSCTFTVRADLQATSDDDLLEGEILYTPITNDDPNCESIKDCRAIQTFNGTRPPE